MSGKTEEERVNHLREIKIITPMVGSPWWGHHGWQIIQSVTKETCSFRKFEQCQMQNVKEQ